VNGSAPAWILYGANGYTGELTARLAVQAGMRPILAGRNTAAVAALAQELDLAYRTAALDDAQALDRLLAAPVEHGRPQVVLHCAGPFSHTSKPMVDACLRNGVHYLDITGEIAVFEALAARYDEAKSAGVMLLPGVGFDVVPSDCLAAHLNRRLPTARRLVLGIRALGGVSRGTATTALEGIESGQGGMVRVDGKLTTVAVGAKTREVDFGRGPRPTVLMPWGDVSTAYHSTGIPNIEVYMALPPAMTRAMQAGRYLGWLTKLPGVMALLKRRVQSGPPGPTDEERARGVSLLWGLVEDENGKSAESRLQTPEGYTLTALSSLLIVRKVLAGQVRPGFQTPSSAYGPDLVMEIPGVERTDL
jgi:short subunit dehydrogenase-like uncharacterized protein